MQKKSEKEEQLIRVQTQKELLTNQSFNWIKEIEDHFNFASNIVERFKKADINTKKEICSDFGWNWILKDKKLLISKHRWLEAIKKYSDDVKDVLARMEPENTTRNQGENSYFHLIRPLVCGLINEVRTRFINPLS